MGLFHKDRPYDINIYSLRPYNEKKHIKFNSIMIVVVIVLLCVSLYYIINSINVSKKKQEYEAQIMKYVAEQELQRQEEQRKEEERKAKLPTLTDEGRVNMEHIYSSETKRAFLTFDDGPSTNTNGILDVLNENEIKATFFVLGVQVEKFPELTKRIYDEGHFIANHGDTHVYSQIYSSVEEVLNEYNRCNDKVKNAIGAAEYNSHLFRFPGGTVGGKYAELKAQAASLLDQNDVMHIDWNALTGDSEKQSPTEEYMMNNLQNTTQGKNSVVILMHDSQAKGETVAVLPKVIDYLKEQGYEFKSFYDIIK